MAPEERKLVTLAIEAAWARDERLLAILIRALTEAGRSALKQEGET